MLYYETLVKDESCDWVVFIHGLGGSTLTWKKQLNDFSENHNILLLDLKGHGKSHDENDARECGIIDIPHDIKAVLDYLGIEKAHFVGLSLGTLVLIFYAIIYPESVLSLVMGGGVIKLDKLGQSTMWIAQRLKKILPHTMMYPIFARVLMPNKNHAVSRKIFIRESLKMKHKEFISWVSSMNILKYADTYIEMLNNLKIPILYIMGDEDYFFLGGVKMAVDMLNDAKLKVIEHCGHVCSIEKAKEFNKMALAFIEQDVLPAT